MMHDIHDDDLAAKSVTRTHVLRRRSFAAEAIRRRYVRDQYEGMTMLLLEVNLSRGHSLLFYYLINQD